MMRKLRSSGPLGRAACAAHARRNFEELTHDGTSVVGLEAVRRFARIYGVEAQLKDLSDDAAPGATPAVRRHCGKSSSTGYNWSAGWYLLSR
jgi:hypothetical protein